MFRQLLLSACCALVFFATVSVPSFSNGQNPTPNAGFEEWTLVDFFGTFYTPNSWDNLDSATAIVGILTCQQTTDAHTGNFAVKLVTYLVFGENANGIITTGNLIIVPPYGTVGGITYHERPDSIACWLKYTPAGGDSTQIQFDLFGTSGDTIGTALLKIGATISNYTRFSAPVKYYSGDTPDLSRWLISSSNGFDAIPGSELYIDDLELLFATGIDEAENQSGMQVINTLVAEQLLISNPKNIRGTLHLYNAVGTALYSYPVTHSSEQMDVSEMDNGMYFCMVTDNDGNVLLRKKIVVQQ